MLQAIPGFFGIRLEEEPEYEIIEEVGRVEIRHYRPALIAQVTVPGDHDHAMDAAFDKLARYIYGGNVQGTQMKMTSPVLQQARGEQMHMTSPLRQQASGSGWTVAFFLANDMAAADAPQPIDPAITLVEEPETVLGSLRYSGNNTEERRREYKEELLETLAGHPRWRVDDEVTWAQYDQPFAIPFLKRNEAHVALRRVG